MSYTHVWTIYLYVCLSERSGQNTEPHWDKIKYSNYLKHISSKKQHPRNKCVNKIGSFFIFLTPFLSATQKAERFLLLLPDFRCFLLNFSLKVTKLRVASLHHLRSAFPALSAQAGVTVRVELMFREQRPSNVQVLTASSRRPEGSVVRRRRHKKSS